MGLSDSSQGRRLLDDRLRQVSDDVKEKEGLKSMIPKLCKVVTSDRAIDEYFSVTGVPDIPAFNGSLTTLERFPGYHKKIESGEFAAQMVTQRKFMDDERYGVLESNAAGMMKAATRTQEKKLVNVFANITSTAFDFMESEEGVSLSSNAHLTKAEGVSTASGFDNAGTSAMSATSIAATRLQMRRFKDDIGERFGMGDNLAIICPENLSDIAEEVNRTPSGMNTADGNVNMNKGRYEVIPYPLLDDFSTTSWGIVDLDAMKQSLIWINRKSPESKNTVDWNTYAWMQAIYARFGVGFIDWRWVFWHTV